MVPEIAVQACNTRNVVTAILIGMIRYAYITLISREAETCLKRVMFSSMLML